MYSTLSHTSDEPAHLACGIEWLSKGVYRLEPQHPPLARVAAAIGPYLAGVRLRPNYWSMWLEGVNMLYAGGNYDRNLALARFGILPFFGLASVVVFFWSRRTSGDTAALCSAFLFTFLPTILAHGGLATTDMALAAMTGASFLMTLVWLENSGRLQSTVWGAILGFTVLSKFSAIPFLGVAFFAVFAVYLIKERPQTSALRKRAKQYVPGMIIAGTAAFLVIWGGLPVFHRTCLVHFDAFAVSGIVRGNTTSCSTQSAR